MSCHILDILLSFIFPEDKNAEEENLGSKASVKLPFMNQNSRVRVSSELDTDLDGSCRDHNRQLCSECDHIKTEASSPRSNKQEKSLLSMKDRAMAAREKAYLRQTKGLTKDQLRNYNRERSFMNCVSKDGSLHVTKNDRELGDETGNSRNNSAYGTVSSSPDRMSMKSNSLSKTDSLSKISRGETESDLPYNTRFATDHSRNMSRKQSGSQFTREMTVRHDGTMGREMTMKHEGTGTMAREMTMRREGTMGAYNRRNVEMMRRKSNNSYPMGSSFPALPTVPRRQSTTLTQRDALNKKPSTT